MKKAKVSIVLLLFCNLLTAQQGVFNTNLKSCLVKADKSSSSMFSEIDSCMQGTYFDFFAVSDIDGNNISTFDLKGETIINYTMHNCPPCLTEKPYLEKLGNEFEDNAILSLVKGSDTEYIEDVQLKNWLIFPDYEQNKFVARNTLGYPLTLLISNTGKILKLSIGGVKTEDIYKAYFDVLSRQ